jgi:hypothetical protein
MRVHRGELMATEGFAALFRIGYTGLGGRSGYEFLGRR